MSFDAGSITGALKLDISDYTHGFLKAEGLANVFPHVITEFMESPLLALADVAKETGKALFEMVNGLSESQHHVAATAEALGVSIEFLDGWGKAAERVGGSSSTVIEMMEHLTRAVGEAMKDKSGDAAEAFQKLGVSIVDAQGKARPLEELMRSIADAMHAAGDSTDRVILAQHTLGRAGAEALAFLGKGAKDADEYTKRLDSMGFLTHASTAKQAEAWVELSTTVQHTWGGIQAMLAEPLREGLTPVLNDMLAWVKTHPEEIKTEISNLSHALVKDLDAIAGAVASLVQNLDKVAIGARLAFDIPTGHWRDAFSAAQDLNQAYHPLHAYTPPPAGSPQGPVNVTVDVTDHRTDIPKQVAGQVKKAMDQVEQRRASAAFAASVATNIGGR